MRSGIVLSKTDEERFAKMRKNLAGLMQDRGLSATQLAKRCLDASGKQCFTTSTITRFLKNEGATLRNSTVKAIANYFNIPVDALINENILKFSGLAKVPTISTNTVPLLTGKGALTNLACFSTWEDYPEIDPKCETLTFIPPPPLGPSTLDRHADLFAFRINDLCMEPTFQSGDILYLVPVDPRTVEHGQFVLLRLRKQGYALASVEEKASELPEEQQEDFLRANSHDYVVRRLLFGNDDNFYAELTRTNWPGGKIRSLKVGVKEVDDQILGLVIGKYTSFLKTF